MNDLKQRIITILKQEEVLDELKSDEEIMTAIKGAVVGILKDREVMEQLQTDLNLGYEGDVEETSRPAKRTRLYVPAHPRDIKIEVSDPHCSSPRRTYHSPRLFRSNSFIITFTSFSASLTGSNLYGFPYPGSPKSPAVFITGHDLVETTNVSR